jgi:alcohol dehydrogenase class IV
MGLDAIGPFTYRGLPHHIVFGPGRVAEARDVVRGFACSNALVLSTAEQRDVGERVYAILGELAVGIFSGAAMHTPVEVTEAALALYDELGADCVVSVGGGSTTGLGKAIVLRTGAPQLAIATTYAGSEVTPILGETKDGAKTTQRSDKLLPNAVIYDVELTLSMPARLSATSGLNAMAHAVEALYAKDGNPIVSLMAEEGLRAFAEALPRIAGDPKDGAARMMALYGAWLCGVCLASTSMALHHKLCHVLGGAFDLPHAETHAIVLPHATAYNAAAAPAAMARIARALKTDDPAAGLYVLARSLKIPVALKEIGMPADGVDKAAALTMENPYWNPRPLDADAIRELIARAYEGAPPPAVEIE